MRAAREARGEARRYDDAALERVRRRGAAPLPAPDRTPPGGIGLPDHELEELVDFSDGEEMDESASATSDPEEARRREEEIRKRLLDIEGALNRIGASGLPYAPRDPNRVGSALDAPRLRAEQTRLREELRELEGQRGRSDPGG